MNSDLDARSPDGTFTVTVSPWEARMSLWIDSPTITRVASGEMVLQFSDRHWSLDDATWLDDRTVQLTVRKYPGNRDPSHIVLVLDCVARTGRVEHSDVLALDAMESEMDRVLRARPFVSQGILPG